MAKEFGLEIEYDQSELQELEYLLDKKAAKRRFREHIFESWFGKCAYCERRAESLDHIKPKFDGGDDRLTNLIPACHRCNQDKGSQEIKTFWKKQYYWNEDRYDAVMFWMEYGFNKDNVEYDPTGMM
jgi:5-methylcytosine-specific restriction endonuclease McrA